MRNPRIANSGVASTVLIVGLALITQCATAASAGSSDARTPRVIAVTLGIGGHAKVGHWTPVRTTIAAGSEPFRGWIELVAPDGDGVPTRFRAARNTRISIAPGGSWTGWSYVKIGRVRADIRVALYTDNQSTPVAVFARRARLERATRSWTLVVGADVGIREAANRLARQQQEKTQISHVTRANALPDRWYGYEGVDVLLWSTADISLVEQLSPQQFAALQRWVELGGHLVISAGEHAPELFAKGGRMFEFRPGDFLEMDPYWKATGLETFARSSTRLLNPDQVPMPVFVDPRGKVLCYEGVIGGEDHPLVWRYPFGFGQITYVALDLERAPLAQWAGRSRLVARLLQPDQENAKGGNEPGGIGQVTHVGFEDIAGQLRGALEQFPGITLVRFSWIAGLLVIYLLLIGPADYYLLRRWKRPQWTWVTFPLIVLSFCAVAALLARQWKGHQVLAKQVDLVDVDVAQAEVRGTTWINLYSPRAAVANVRLLPVAPVKLAHDPSILLSWQGLPGTGLGGMNTTGSVGALNNQYQIFTHNDTTPNTAPIIEALPVHSSSTKPMIGRWWAPARTLAAGKLTTNVDGFLHGEIVNPLNVELDHCAVYFGNWSYRLDRRLAPGDRVDLEYISPLDLRWQLTRRQLSDSKARGRPWDRTNFTDIPRIMEMVMFHGAAGGRQFTHLADRYQGFADLSGHLRSGRAILVGQARSKATRLHVSVAPELDDHLSHWTFYRVIMPVKHVAME